MTMNNFFDETMQGLLESVSIDKGRIPLAEKKNMPAPTFTAYDMEKKLIDEIVHAHSKMNIWDDLAHRKYKIMFKHYM